MTVPPCLCIFPLLIDDNSAQDVYYSISTAAVYLSSDSHLFNVCVCLEYRVVHVHDISSIS